MKTEKEFSEHFLNSTGLHFAIHSDDDIYFKKLSENYWTDLTSHLSFYFSNEDRWAITEKAAQMIRAAMKTNPTLDEAWKNVLRDFNGNHYWNFARVYKKPATGHTAEQKIFWKLFKYAWAFFQSMVVLKIAVYYFGLESASHPDQTSVFWVWVFFGMSFGSLTFFAYRNRADLD